MRHGLKLLSTSFVIACGLGMMGAAHAAPDDATLNQCWGERTSQVAPLGEEPGLGEHASSFPTPRRGVGNVSKEDHGGDLEGGQALASGAQGAHANAVAPFAGITEECDGAPASPP
jgi:hypothetical protein